MDFWHYERDAIDRGYNLICGVDEAGRGPLAGPVFAAAVILPFGIVIPELDDSKKLSETKRELLFDKIVSVAIGFSIGSADHKEIDELNILQATFLAMNRAVDSLSTNPDFVLVDGNRDPVLKYRSQCITGGDGKSASIAAASILAKVSRDRFMLKMTEKFPQYVFEKHKGYGTRLHYEMLNEYGPSEIHRHSFLKKWKATELEKTHGKSSLISEARRRGEWGEAIAKTFLINKDYCVADQGFRSKFGEIDLVVKNQDHIVFVEVKLRKNSEFAHACEFVSKDKQRKIKTTASLWLNTHNNNLQPRFDVIEIYAIDDNAQPEIIHIENAF